MSMIPLKMLANGFSMPALGMGSWCFGGRETHDPDNDDAGQTAALRQGVELGYSLIDTAEYYADGFAEILIGRAIAGFDREKLFLTSKVWKTHLDSAGVIHAAENSLRRLKTDYLDLYLYHQVSDIVPLEETIAAMNTLVDRGLVRYIGVSNFAPERLRRAMQCSSHPIMVNQVHYSLQVREVENGLLDFCQQNDVMLQAWRPLRGLVPSPLTEALCRKYDCSLQTLALAWLIRQKNVSVITASTSFEHLKSNLQAVRLNLSDADAELLQRDMPGKTFTGTVPLS